MPIDEKTVKRTRQRIEIVKGNIKKETIMFLRKSLLSGKPYCNREEIKENLCEKIPNFDEKLLLYIKGDLLPRTGWMIILTTRPTSECFLFWKKSIIKEIFITSIGISGWQELLLSYLNIFS